MSTWLIAGMGVVYFIVACDQFYKGGVGTGIMFLGYALGNVGLVMVAK
jgi:TM2 domain-containing membrane protein YozV